MQKITLQRKLLNTANYRDQFAEETEAMLRLRGDFLLELDGLVAGGQMSIAEVPGFDEVSERLLDYPARETNRSNGIPVNTVAFGSSPRRPMGRGDWCSRSALDVNAPDLGKLLMDLCANLEEAFYSAFAPLRHERHKKVASEILPDYRLTGAFSSGVFNRDCRIPYHYDAGNCDGQWSMMVTFKKGCEGGNLVLPELGAVIENENGSALLFDGQSLLHGVSEFKIADGGHRVTIVYYTLKELFRCLPPTEEFARAKQSRDAVEERSYKELKERGINAEGKTV